VLLPPEELFAVADGPPPPTGLVLVEMLDGFIDAGAARRLAREHLLDGPSQVVARFDTDLLHDYRARRPPMLFVENHWQSYDAPSLEIRLLNDAAGAPYLVLVGPEPDVLWERFVGAVRLLVDRLGVRLTIGTNAIPMAVPHSRPVGITAHASQPELLEDYPPWIASVQVPGSAGHLLEHRLAEAGLASMGFAVHVPHYLAQAAYPPAAEAMLAAVARAGGLSLSLDALMTASAEAQQSITALVEQSEELAELVRTLEAQYDAVVANRPGGALGNGPLPTGEELGAELERFLAEQTKRGDDPTG
jgi:predicted ATP-grasp superfamily ATP-dependent carboligase